MLQAATIADRWTVVAERFGAGVWRVRARGSDLTVVVGPRLPSGRLVSVPEYNRCGCVPPRPTGFDVDRYLELGNCVDAASIAAVLERVMRS